MAHSTFLYVMPEVFNRASSVFLDSPVKPWNDKNVEKPPELHVSGQEI
jgi:hypothetical protein